MYMMNSMHSMMLGTQQDKHNMNFIQEAAFFSLLYEEKRNRT